MPGTPSVTWSGRIEGNDRRSHGRGARDGLAVFSQPGQVQFDSPPHLAQEFRFCFGHGCYSRQIGAPGDVAAVIGTLDDDCVAGHGVLRFNPACFRMLRSVPGGKTALGLPATVTRPGLDGCLYCRWLPLITTRYQPSASMSLSISPTLSGTVHLSPERASGPGE